MYSVADKNMEETDGRDRWMRQMEETDGKDRWKRQMEATDGRDIWKRRTEETDGRERYQEENYLVSRVTVDNVDILRLKDGFRPNISRAGLSSYHV